MTERTRIAVPAVLMRGGTSKGVFFHMKDLPTSDTLRDTFFLHALGSPDPFRKQIDGVGAATSSTSKVAIISPSQREDSDVDYFFGQVALDQPLVDYSTTCGNLLSAVGPFAIEEGLLEITDGEAVVRIWQVNLKQRIVARFSVENGIPCEAGDFQVDGIPFPGGEIKLEFLNASERGLALPTSNPSDQFEIDGKQIRATLVEAGAPTAIVLAEDMGIAGDELPDSLNSNPQFLHLLEEVRAQASVLFGIAETVEKARGIVAAPKVMTVAPRQAYVTTSGAQLAAEQMDIMTRTLSVGAIHHACPVSAASALAAACSIPGTVCERILPCKQPYSSISIGHPAGVLKAGAKTIKSDGKWVCESISMSRTARRLMEGMLFALV